MEQRRARVPNVLWSINGYWIGCIDGFNYFYILFTKCCFQINSILECQLFKSILFWKWQLFFLILGKRTSFFPSCGPNSIKGNRQSEGNTQEAGGDFIHYVALQKLHHIIKCVAFFIQRDPLKMHMPADSIKSSSVQTYRMWHWMWLKLHKTVIAFWFILHHVDGLSRGL